MPGCIPAVRNQQMEARETLSNLVSPACGLLFHISHPALLLQLILYSSSFPSPYSLVFFLPFYSFSCFFMFLQQPTQSTKPCILLCLLFALSDICPTSTSPSTLSLRFYYCSISPSCIPILSFCPFQSPFFSSLSATARHTSNISYGPYLTVHTSWIPLSALPLHLQSLTETSISHLIPLPTLTLGLPSPSPTLFICFWAISLLSQVENCQPDTHLLLISFPS